MTYLAGAVLLNFPESVAFDGDLFSSWRDFFSHSLVFSKDIGISFHVSDSNWSSNQITILKLG